MHATANSHHVGMQHACIQVVHIYTIKLHCWLINIACARVHPMIPLIPGG